jgi:hypothetical protein
MQKKKKKEKKKKKRRKKSRLKEQIFLGKKFYIRQNSVMIA